MLYIVGSHYLFEGLNYTVDEACQYAVCVCVCVCVCVLDLIIVILLHFQILTLFGEAPSKRVLFSVIVIGFP